MTLHIKVALAAALLLAASPVASAQRSLQSTLPEVTGQCATVQTSRSVNEACVAALEAALNSPDVKQQALEAARAGDKRAMTDLLLKAGLKKGQLQGAQLEFKAARVSAGAEARIKIEVRCCPLVIIISF